MISAFLQKESARSAISGKPRIVIVKWDRFSGETIASLARRNIAEAEVAIYDTAAKTVDSLRTRPAKIGVFGLTLPDMDGLDLLKLVACERLVQRVVVVTWRTDERVRQLLRGVGSHVLIETRSQGPERLEEAFRWASGAVSRPSILSSKNLAFRSGRPSLEQMFSERELQVLAVLADGCDDQSAGEVLGLRSSTVHSHRQRIMGKLEVKTRSELIREALRRGVIRFTDSDTIRPGLHDGFDISNRVG